MEILTRFFRPEENALLIWNAEAGRTAYVNGAELTALARWAAGEESNFAARLQRLGLVTAADKSALAEAIAACRHKKAPPNAFCAPESLHIELTSQCPLRCPQCYKGAQEAHSLDNAYLHEVIRQAAAMQVFQIALGGGEPLLYPHLGEIIAHITRRGMAATLTTSGAGLTAARLDALAHHGLKHMQVSLNGSSEAINSRSRGGFAEAMHALALLRNARLSYGVNWVARRDNIDDLPAFIEAMKIACVGNINILRYKPAPNENYRDYALTPDQTDFLLRVVKAAKGIRLKVDSAYAFLLCRLHGRTSFMGGCGAGRRFLALDAQARYRPCSHIDLHEAGKPLRDVWEASPHLALFRQLPQKAAPPCAHCAYLPGCGGCRAVVVEEAGMFYGGDTGCGGAIVVE